MQCQGVCVASTRPRSGLQVSGYDEPRAPAGSSARVVPLRRETERVSLFSEFPFPVFTRPTWMEVGTGPEHMGRAPRGYRFSGLPNFTKSSPLLDLGTAQMTEAGKTAKGFPGSPPLFFLMGTAKT